MANKIVENPWNPLAHLCIKGWEGKLRESRRTALILCLVELLNSGSHCRVPLAKNAIEKSALFRTVTYRNLISYSTSTKRHFTLCRTSSTEKSPVGSDVKCCLNYCPQTAGGPCFFGQWWSALLKPEVAQQAPARVCFGAHAARNYNILPSKFVCAYFNSTKPWTPKYILGLLFVWTWLSACCFQEMLCFY